MCWRSRSLRGIAAFLMMAILGSAAPANADAQSPSAATASISGRVVHASTGEPLARARVTLTSPALVASRVVITDAAGSFRFTMLPAGSYSLTATRTGFVTQRFGARRMAEATSIALAAAQQLTTVQIALTPGGVIAGRVLDEDGTPFAGAAIEALATRTENGQQTLVSMGSASTDDRGGFRISGLPGGQYFVSAFDPAFTNVADDTGALRYTPTYYPGVALFQDARLVTVTPGADPKAIEFKLRIVRPATVSGVIAPADKRPLLSAAVIMSTPVGEGLSIVSSEDVDIRPDGTFAFRNVPPGRYQIRARGMTDVKGQSLFATHAVTVEGSDVAGIALTLTPGATVDGVVAFEAERTQKPSSLAGLRVRAPLIDGSSFGDALTGDVQANGRFTIRGVMTGTHYLTMEGLSYPWVIKSIMFRGRDIADGVLDVVAAENLHNVRIVVTDTATEVQGIVRSGGSAVGDALVVVFSPGPQFWTTVSRRFRVARTDAGGRYHLRGLPPGEYHVAAVADVDESEILRAATLQKLLPFASALSLNDRDSVGLDLTLVRLPTSVAFVR